MNRYEDIIFYQWTEQICIKQYYYERLNGVTSYKYLHNCIEPAFIKYNKDGTKKSEMYCFYGKLHNLYGPAKIEYSNGEIIERKWAILGNTLSLSEWLKHPHNRLSYDEKIRIKLNQN